MAGAPDKHHGNALQLWESRHIGQNVRGLTTAAHTDKPVAGGRAGP